MTLSERERFILYSTKIAFSSQGFPPQVRQQVLKFLRDKNCPNISDKEWQEIANDIRAEEQNAITTMAEGMMLGLGGKIGLPSLVKKLIPHLDTNMEQVIKKAEESALLNHEKITQQDLVQLEKFTNQFQDNPNFSQIAEIIKKHIKEFR